MNISNVDTEDEEQTLKMPGSTDSPLRILFQKIMQYFWYYVISGTSIALPSMIKCLYVKAPVIAIEKLEKRSDQVAVMTGGPRGIGFDIVKKLFQLDYTVILGVRTIAVSQEGIDKIRAFGIPSGRVKFLNLDLISLNSVQKFAKEVLASEEGSRIDLLLNNAGFVNRNYEMTPDNIESTFQVNYLSHFLLTNLLLPRIKETVAKKGGDPCHIVNTSSHAQRAGKINFNELEIR
ncbi:unnamed protein product [Orchesella dallaii]|uniref:Short-chain dehydrogenase TIC 32, chloroplastic n=1 Tax=Orchesella dallaii TaxID=48710 RepID=A0ABP1QKB3_9HEXA